MKKIVHLGSVIAGGLAVWSLPAMVLAENGSVPSEITDIESILSGFLDWVDILIPIAMGLVFVAFAWGLAVFIFNAGDAEKRKEGRQLMIWGVIALAVLTLIWGIIAWLGSMFNITTDDADDLIDTIIQFGDE